MKEKDQVIRNFELLKLELANKSAPWHAGPPELISMNLDDYHARLIGKNSDGLQFFITEPFTSKTEQEQRREFLALFIFDKSGEFVEARVDECTLRHDEQPDYVESLLSKRLSELGEITFEDIKVKPFVTEQHGVLMGLIPSLHNNKWYVELLPGNFMAFHEPWDSGQYDT